MEGSDREVIGVLGKGMDAIRAHLASLPPMDALSLEELRANYDKAEHVFALPEGVRTDSARVGGVPSEILTPPGPGTGGERTLLYLHGGGYALGSPRSHRHLAAAIAVQAGMRAVVPDYRLAPEHPYPGALEDALAVYRALLEEGAPARSVVIGGDSAGGGLTAATLVAIREAGLPMPAAGVLISPWTDMTCRSGSLTELADVDPMVRPADLHRWAQAYLAGADPRTPLASPRFADLRGLPPLLVQVGSDEVLLDDARAIVDAAGEAGVAATLEIWPGMIHVWHWFGEYLDEAGAAVRRIGGFLREHA